MTSQILFSEKNKKIIISLPPAELAQRVRKMLRVLYGIGEGNSIQLDQRRIDYDIATGVYDITVNTLSIPTSRRLIRVYNVFPSPSGVYICQ